MKRETHILLGAAVALPIAAPLSPALALGAVWWGMVGGGFPDWLDFRSDFRRNMRHRGVSHSIFLAAVLTVGFWAVLHLVSSTWPSLTLDSTTTRAWVLAFAAGFLSHIIADACTHAGVRPFLPFSQRKWWVLPQMLRGKSAGGIDTVARLIALSLLILGVARYLLAHGFV